MANVITQIGDEIQKLDRSYEILVVDDGSTDETVGCTSRFLDTQPLRIIRLSRNFGKENAISAGLEKAIGKAIIIIDADLQEPVSYIGTFLKHWDEGYEMVYGFREHRDDESTLKKIGTGVFYAILNKTTSVQIPRNARDFRLMDRKVVDALCSLPESNRFMKGLYAWVGFKSLAVPIEIETRKNGNSKFNHRNLIALGITAITSFSVWPLRVWLTIGSVISISSIVYAIWIAARTLLWGSDVPGWATITVAIFFLGGVQLLSIGVIGEYLGRVFSEAKSRPNHIVAEEISHLEET